MTTLYVLDVPEFAPLAIAARGQGLTVTSLGTYLRVRAEGEIVVDRAAADFADAVWFSLLGGGFKGRLERFDAAEIRIGPDEDRR